MKKRTLVLLGTAAVLALSIAGTCGAVFTASAASIDQDDSTGTSETTVTYSVKDTWSVTIPESIEINGELGTGTGEVSANGVVIEKDTTLTVTVESENEWKLKNSSNNKEMEYELKVGSGNAFTEKGGNEVLSVQAGNSSGSATLNAAVKEAEKKYSTGGNSYEDTLTFTVTVS